MKIKRETKLRSTSFGPCSANLTERNELDMAEKENSNKNKQVK